MPERSRAQMFAELPELVTTPALTVIVCTHNPRLEYLEATLASIQAQKPLKGGRRWELVVIDNASVAPLADCIDLKCHAGARVVREEKLGLSHARLRGFHEARAEILVYVDDDNVLDGNYLLETLRAFDADARLAAVGGRSIPRYEVEPPAWFGGLGLSLACRDLGDAPIVADWTDVAPDERAYPECAPIGAGMGLRRSAYAAYVATAVSDPVRMSLGRRGSDLASAEDNDIVLSMLAEGWKVAYLPQLYLEHLIPAGRLSPAYLERYAYSSSKTWVEVLNVHGIRPWPGVATWTVALRKARAYVRTRAWASIENRITWRGACGLIEGRAAIGSGRQ